MGDDHVERLRALSTSTVSDALDRLGVAGQVPDIAALDRAFRVCGRAWTLRYGPVGQDGGTVGDYIDDLGPDDVVVLDNQGRTDATVWGDLLTTVAHRRQVAGTVIDGVCRDLERSLSLRYPIFARGNWMRTGKDRVRVEQTGVPVAVGGVRVEPGDLLLGDMDGLVVVPAARAAEVLDRAEQIDAAEDGIRQAVVDGMSLREARAAAGYHALQRRDS